MGSPAPEVLKMMYWALLLSAQAGGPAKVLRGESNSDGGNPVASARSPTEPAPNSIDMRLCRRVIMFPHKPIEIAEGARQALTKVDFRASEALAPWAVAAA